jgi:5-(carboxyamino)imidazole ribonucleotide mutase
MPSGVAPLVILSPENAALATAKIFGISNENIRQKVVEFQEKQRQMLKEDNASLS